MDRTEDQRRRLFAMADDYWGVNGNPGIRKDIRDTHERVQKLEREFPVVKWMVRGCMAVLAVAAPVLFVIWQRV